MLTMMLVAHLLGDYVFQFNALALWKMRSMWGVVAHGGIVTLTTLVCALWVDPVWWPYAVFIGVVHTAVDVIKARWINADDTRWEMIFYLMDQGMHLFVIVCAVVLSGVEVRAFERLSPQMMALVIGYLLVMKPARVLMRFIVRGMWGPDAAPPLGTGKKFMPMLERVLITSAALVGQMYLIPLSLLPRCLTLVRIQRNGTVVWTSSIVCWEETVLGMIFSTIVGAMLRLMLFAG